MILTEELEKFVGVAIKTVESTSTYRSISKKYLQPDPADESVIALKNICETNGWRLRILFPGSFYTQDIDDQRMNVKVEVSDGLAKISSIYFR